MKLGCLGPRTNSVIAAKKLRSIDSSIDSIVDFSCMGDVFEALDKDKVDKIIVPVCNSITGDITKYWFLVAKYDFRLEREINIPIGHSIGAYDGSIDVIMSHEQALKQCSEYLDDKFPYARREATQSTEEAARIVSERREGAAIANLETCLYYDLRIVDEDIVRNNYSTFIVLRKECW